jgi:hypothetical protein
MHSGIFVFVFSFMAEIFLLLCFMVLSLDEFHDSLKIVNGGLASCQIVLRFPCRLIISKSFPLDKVEPLSI